MKTIKTYETFIGKEVSQEFDADFAIAKIKHFYNDYEVKDIFDEELKNWISEDEIGEKWEDIYDWFYDNYKEESKSQEVIDKKAQLALAVSDVVVDQLMDWYEKEFKIELTESQRDELSKRIIKTYEGIDPNNW